ncbi:MAG: hypothetical protein QM689_12590 [Oscillospiraceae bacterium]
MGKIEYITAPDKPLSPPLKRVVSMATHAEVKAALHILKKADPRDDEKIAYIETSLKRRGAEMKKAAASTKVNNLRMRALHLGGLTNDEIADKLNVPVIAVDVGMKRCGIVPNEYRPPEPHIWGANRTVVFSDAEMAKGTAKRK